MFLTRRVAAWPVTIVLYHGNVFLVHDSCTCVIFCFFTSWSMQLWNDSVFQKKKKNVTGKEDISRFFTILKKTKNIKDKNIKTTLQFLSWLVQAKGLKAFWFWQKEWLPYLWPLFFYHNDVLLVHFVYCVIFCFFSSWSMQFLNDWMLQSSRSFLSLNLSLEHEDP